MSKPSRDHLIVNSAFEEPSKHWLYDTRSERYSLRDGRRPAGFVRASDTSKGVNDPGVFVPLDLPNRIRERVGAWRMAGYPWTTAVSKRLLEHWYDPELREGKRLFFCQLEAIETLIWLTESPPAERAGIEIPNDGGAFERVCSKMATGSGKTAVMGMLVAWQTINKVTNPQDKRFSKNFLVVAPGLTVKTRLQV